MSSPPVGLLSDLATSPRYLEDTELQRLQAAVEAEILPETPPTVVGHGILEDNMLYLTARRAEDGMLFRVFLNPDDLRRLLRRAMEQEETAAIAREIAG